MIRSRVESVFSAPPLSTGMSSLLNDVAPIDDVTKVCDVIGDAAERSTGDPKSNELELKLISWLEFWKW